MLRTEVIGWGEMAADFCSRHGTARVEAVFERSIHVRAGDEIICIGDASIGNGPLNAIVDEAFAVSLRRGQVSPGMAVRFGEAASGAPAFALWTRQASLWTPPPCSVVQPRAARCSAIAKIEQLARETASPDGLALLVLGLEYPDTPLNRIAAPRVAALRHWLAGDDDGGEQPAGLLGLGPGLTPSGDDVLSGVLIALHATGETVKFAKLGGAIRTAAPAATSLASRAMLASAAKGQAGEALHRVVNALVGGVVDVSVGWVKHVRDPTWLAPPGECWVALKRLTQPTDLLSLAARASQAGHTSGWDALAGAALAIKCGSSR
jgi:hypothetical protein